MFAYDSFIHVLSTVRSSYFFDILKKHRMNFSSQISSLDLFFLWVAFCYAKTRLFRVPAFASIFPHTLQNRLTACPSNPIPHKNRKVKEAPTTTDYTDFLNNWKHTLKIHWKQQFRSVRINLLELWQDQ